MTPAAAGEDLEEALSVVLARFAGSVKVCSPRLVQASRHGGGVVLLFPIQDRSVHVVGACDLAEEVRALLRDGFGGWYLHPLPEDVRTRVEVLAPPVLATRFYNLLTSNGFTTVQEAVMVPDAAWLDFHHVGTRFLESFRAAAAQYVPEEPALVWVPPSDELMDRRAYLAGGLSGPATLRYPEFVERLARSRIPLAALDKITESLNAEPLPPGDPIVTLLLDTAGEQDLLDYYTATHDP
jgi:hypothetical protein